MAFIEQMRAQGFAVESVGAVLRGQGLQIAARTYRTWKQPDRQIAARTICDALVIDALRQARSTRTGGRRPKAWTGGAR